MYINSGSKHPIVLASSSPRRKELLEQLGIRFAILPAEVPEIPQAGVSPSEEAQRIACEKAYEVAQKVDDCSVVIGADTMVVINNQILGKPSSSQEAEAMLKTLAGRWHKVITGWCVIRLSDKLVRKGVSESKVFIRELSDDFVRAYVRSGEPMDKAGAYAAQGIGACMISRIEGSYTNVVGLPLAEVVCALEEIGVIKPASDG